MHYDPTYEATVATVIPLIFVAIVVDLGLGKRSATPLAAGLLLSVVIVLLAAELLCLNALSNQRDLRQGESVLVAGAVLFSGGLVLYRVAEPLLKILWAHYIGQVAMTVFGAGFVVLVVLHFLRFVSGGTAIVIFGLCVLWLGFIIPAAAAAVEQAAAAIDRASKRRAFKRRQQGRTDDSDPTDTSSADDR